MYYDFSQYPADGGYFAGSEKKISISIKDSRYILKFQKRSDLGPRYNHISEYVGSQIFSICGMDVQKTCLGTYNGENVVACKVFTGDGESFVPFNDVGESSLDTDREHHQYSYDDIMTMLDANRKLTSVEKTIELFWNTFIIDALTGNFDRHGGNWGFIKEDGRYRASPVFDNGSCLYPMMNDENEMEKIIRSEEMTDDRIFRYPTSQIKLNGRKSSYFDVISSLKIPECNDALRRMVPSIDMAKINNMIDGISSITDIHREFYKHMLRNRYEKILVSSMRRLNDEGA